MEELTAGPELDAAIHTQVFDYRREEALPGVMAWYCPHGQQYSVLPIPEYSGDVADAWLIVEKLQGQGYAFGLWMTPSLSSVLNAPLAAFKRGVHPPAMYDQNPEIAWGLGDPGDTNPALAICKAALRALREGD